MNAVKAMIISIILCIAAMYMDKWIPGGIDSINCATIYFLILISIELSEIKNRLEKEKKTIIVKKYSDVIDENKKEK